MKRCALNQPVRPGKDLSVPRRLQTSAVRNAFLRIGIIVAFGLSMLAHCPRAIAGGGVGKSVQTMIVYQNGGAPLEPEDAAKLARYYMFSFNRKRYYEISPNTYDAVRAHNPEILIFNYQQGPDIWVDQDGLDVLYVNNIVRYDNARGHSMGNLNVHNPDFFLLNSAGQRIHSYYSDNRYMLDFGSAGFQAYWLEATEHDVVDQPWVPDGIFVDNTTARYGTWFGDRPAKYPTDAEWTSAMIDFHAALAAGLHEREVKIWTNTGNIHRSDGYDAWLAIDADSNRVDFLNSEGTFCHGWGQADCTWYDEAGWKRQVDIMVNLVNCGAAIFSHVDMAEGASGTDNYGQTVTYWEALWYAMGSYLLGRNDTRGNDTFFFSNKVDAYNKLYWYDEYDRVDMGDSLGTYRLTVHGGTNIYWREFAKGYVYVNPTGSDCSSIPLPVPCKQLSHATINEDLEGFPDVTNISLDSHRAAIVLKTSSFVHGDVAASHVFYNNSAWDGNDTAANSADDASIAADKMALRPGQTATFANYTSYSRGVNGIMLDIDHLVGTPSAGDFAFEVGNTSNLNRWTTLAVTPTVAVRSGVGVGGSDRVSVVFPDGAVTGKWLKVTFAPTGEVFYFGNAIGETGNSTADARVTPADGIAVRNNPATLANNPASITHACDFDRDRKVGPTDYVFCRNNGTNSGTALQLISPFTNYAPTVSAGLDAEVDLSVAPGAVLDGTVDDDGYPSGSLTVAWSKVAGLGDVTFDDANAADTTAMFSSAGVYALQLKVDDGDLTATDTVQITVIDPATDMFFADDFDDDNLDGWTTLYGGFETFRYLSEPGYEVHATVLNSRMRADLAEANLSDTVYVSFKARHTGGSEGSGSGMGYKSGRIWFVDDSGNGFGLLFGLSQSADGRLELMSTTADGADETLSGAFSDPGPAGGNDPKRIDLVYDRLVDQVECLYEGVSKGTLSVSLSHRNFTRVVVHLYNYDNGWWGQMDIDDVRVASSPG